MLSLIETGTPRRGRLSSASRSLFSTASAASFASANSSSAFDPRVSPDRAARRHSAAVEMPHVTSPDLCHTIIPPSGPQSDTDTADTSIPSPFRQQKCDASPPQRGSQNCRWVSSRLPNFETQSHARTLSHALPAYALGKASYRMAADSSVAVRSVTGCKTMPA